MNQGAIQTKGIRTVSINELSFGQLRPKTIPKQLLHIYKKPLKIPENEVFGNNTCQKKATFLAKSPEKAFLALKMVKRPSEGKNFTRIFYFGSRLLSFRAENTSKRFAL